MAEDFDVSQDAEGYGDETFDAGQDYEAGGDRAHAYEADGYETLVDEAATVETPDDLEESVLVLEEVDNALVLPVWEPTGDAQVDDALELLASLDELSVHDHAEVLTSVHSSLHQRLTDISA